MIENIVIRIILYNNHIRILRLTVYSHNTLKSVLNACKYISINIHPHILMKHFIFTLTLLFLIVIHADGQTDSKHFSYTTYIGTGLSMGQPSQTPFNWQIIAHYHIGQRFTIGAGSGLSIYEKALIPLYANAQFFMTRPKKLTPYLECNIGGSLAAAKETNGGFYLSPSVGAQVKLTQKLKMNIALGYEIQQLERLKQRTDEYFHTEFKEELSHHSITLKVGLTY